MASTNRIQKQSAEITGLEDPRSNILTRLMSSGLTERISQRQVGEDKAIISRRLSRELLGVKAVA